MSPKNAKQRSEQLKHLREQHQAGVEAAQALLKEQQVMRKELCRALKAGPLTVPELAAAAHLPTQQVLWHMVALKKYGLVAEAGLSDGYYQYRLVEEGQKMSRRADPNFLLEIKKYGAVNVEACFNCGNCTAICPLATDATPFPRNNIRLLQLGLKDRLQQSLDPWLCYYCGDCSATCPRQAEPAEAQMTVRRWLTAQYDWTGLARKFYTSKGWEVGAILLVSACVVLMFALFHGPIVTAQVELNTFAPVAVIDTLDRIMLVGLSFFLLSNVLRMYLFTMWRDKRVKAPLALYVSEAWNLIYHFATQQRFSKCDDEKKSFWQKPRWRNHWLLVSGYVTMFALVVGFLPWFQTDNRYPIYNPQRWLGYYATIVLLYSVADILWGRVKHDYQMHRFSHLSDWIFPILLLLTTLTGISVHTFRYLELPLATYYMYVAHLAVVVPMLTLEVPFGKWSHLAYRPFAIYFQTVKEKAKALGRESPAGAPASAA